ncbi:hypothetical protein GEV33_007730 [Tenebrio molitor]|uniref:Integrase catalytic domain-containing protein n=1 Tax=Tenebrio molitor TaxID=7067 RepID=A0A8J6LIJ9_TENMO|nr:hypothetical protein GEV33_007730 [Tenebrio molitor]
MFREAAQYVRKCPSCQRYKTPQQQPPGKMYPTPNRQPWETVSTDLVGPLPRSSRGNCYVVVMQDRFTKWVQCRAVRKATARAVTQALYEEVITRFGCPVTVISDNGTQYSGGTFRTLLLELGIAHRLTRPYTPHAFNTSRHESTRNTPALLNFGRELVVPNAVHRPAPGNAVHHSERLRLLKDTFELVRVNLARVFAKQGKYYNLRHREWRCHPGDHVLKRDHPLSSGAKGFAAKLSPKYSGPYTVTKVLSPVVYNLQSPSGQKILRAHIKDLKPYQMPESPADFANICRMPNQRIPPPPNGLQSVRQQLNRRLAGQADLMQAARRAEERTETRTTRDVRSTSAPPRPNPTPVGPPASGETSSLSQTRPAALICWINSPDSRALPPLTGESRGPGTPMDLTVRSQRHGPPPPPPPRASNEGPSSDTDLPPTATTSTWPPPRHHGVANAGELPTRRPAHSGIGGPPKKSTVSPRDASPTAPPSKDEASIDGGKRAPVCPARRDATGSWTHNHGYETDPLPKLADPARVNPKGEFLIIRPRATCTPTAELIPPVRRDQTSNSLPGPAKVPPKSDETSAMGQLLDLKWTVVDEVDTALASAGSPDPSPPAPPARRSPREEDRGNSIVPASDFAPARAPAPDRTDTEAEDHCDGAERDG